MMNQRVMEQRQTMYVYVMASGGRSKIGISAAPRRRRSSLTTANPDGVNLIYTVQAGKRAREMEVAAHKMLEQFACSREWFRVHPFVAIAVVDHLITGDPSAELVGKILEWVSLDAKPYHRQDTKRLFALEDDLLSAWKPASDLIIRL